MTKPTYHAAVSYLADDNPESLRDAARLIDNGEDYQRPRAWRTNRRAEDTGTVEVIYYATLIDGDPPIREPLTLYDALDLVGRIARLPFIPTRIVVAETDPLDPGGETE